MMWQALLHLDQVWNVQRLAEITFLHWIFLALKSEATRCRKCISSSKLGRIQKCHMHHGTTYWKSKERPLKSEISTMFRLLRRFKCLTLGFECFRFPNISTSKRQVFYPHIPVTDLCHEVSWVWSPVGSCAQPPGNGKRRGTPPKSGMLKPVLIGPRNSGTSLDTTS